MMTMMRGVIYPEEARLLRRQGAVTVSFVVDETGEVGEAHVVRGLGAGLDEEALHAVRSARFEPGVYQGQPAAMRVTMPIRFRLPS
jgi:periplasmic protein TonB